MARSLNSKEAEIFSEEIVATCKFPILGDTAESLLKRREEALQLTPELGFWFGDYLRGFHGF
jgi:hypothetical protein